MPAEAPRAAERQVELSPITAADVAAVGQFLHSHLNSRLSAGTWAAVMRPPWATEQPNHGFLLRDADQVVGAYLAFYSERDLGGRTERFCNLAAWCVHEGYRSQGLRLLRAALRQKGYHFTDLSPSGNVVPLNARLGFTTLDTTTALVPNLPWPASSRARLLSDRQDIEGVLSGRELEIYRDHAQTAAARHLVLVEGVRSCYVIVRRDRRKRLPLFATVLHVSDPALFARHGRLVLRHLLLRHRVPFTLAERRVVARVPAPAVTLAGPPRMFRSPALRHDQIDYLYSELTCVAW